VDRSPSAPIATPNGTMATPVASELSIAPFTAERLHDHAVSSIAVGKAPKLASFGREALLFDKGGWRARPLPKPRTEGLVAEATIYYGRDNQPRLLGAWKSGQVVSPLYLRHKVAGFVPEPSEIASLATAAGELYGVLGYEDPEVVCATDAVCLVKTVRGWKRMAAGPEPEEMFMTSQGVHVARGPQLFVLEDVSFRPVADLNVDGQPLSDITDVCYESSQRIWLAAGGAVYLKDAAMGSVFAPEVAVPTGARALVCEGAGSVWVAGASGAAHFDGANWSAVPGELNDLEAAAKGHDAVLVGGKTGLYALRPSL
jgi:hypothetical protein